MSRKQVQRLLEAEGYRLVEDAWVEHGRLTFVHDDDADRSHISRLARVLQAEGWEKSKTQLRTFGNPTSGEIVEVEPGGAGTSGHFIHYVSAFATS
ncbi:hypothetical protein IC762_04005 [Bradyrhizobium genosp. L]|uniref:hypothetical protein n=1 Tax=Bradyrhizobium genosp. L TaxID=83637 RepID=UPI0018A306DB|nr:hypothetical protein [Bradyrhizobium genosp. L]QPF85505.1 hypothetical protein IC762_04005 [Bradyrhizobium genosp. L]